MTRALLRLRLWVLQLFTHGRYRRGMSLATDRLLTKLEGS